MKNKISKKMGLSLLILLILFAVSGCVPGDGSYTTNNPAGLLSGIWHGWIAPFSLIFSIFNKLSFISRYNCKIIKLFYYFWINISRIYTGEYKIYDK